MELIRRFSSAGFGLGESTRSHSEALEKEKKRRLPEEFRCYIDQFAPEQSQYFTKVGNPLLLYGGASLPHCGFHRAVSGLLRGDASCAGGNSGRRSDHRR